MIHLRVILRVALAKSLANYNTHELNQKDEQI